MKEINKKETGAGEEPALVHCGGSGPDEPPNAMKTARPGQNCPGRVLRLEKGARLGYALISNYAFADGDKRIGMCVMLTCLEVNGIRIDCTNSEVVAARSSSTSIRHTPSDSADIMGLDIGGLM